MILFVNRFIADFVKMNSRLGISAFVLYFEQFASKLLL